MLIHGKDYEMYASVNATCKIAELCPDQDIDKFTEIMDYPLPKMLPIVAETIAILINANEDDKYYSSGKEYKQNYITKEEILSLTSNDIFAMQKEMFATMNRDGKTEVETEPTAETKKEVANP